jgi:predicted DNA-binding WGR domain protein
VLRVITSNNHYILDFGRWFVFRSWGRVGTTIGDTKLTKMDTKQEAIEDFISLYEEKTGNLWENRNNFEKQPGKLYPLDIDYGEVTISYIFLSIKM